jgi:hypothetical protein
MKETELQQGICRTALEHHGKILQNLNKLRLNSAFCDVEVSAGDGYTVKVRIRRILMSLLLLGNLFFYEKGIYKFFSKSFG